MDTLNAPIGTPVVKSIFKGATAFRLWIRPHRCLRRHRHLPSKEPWLFSHGYLTSCRWNSSPRKTFKGAMAFQPWIPGIRRREPRTRFGLQRSHGLSAMDTSASTTNARCFSTLQWSHSLSAMDTTMSSTLIPTEEVPSMEPWPFSHGYMIKLGIEESEQELPSMEPWPFSHGYHRLTARPRSRPTPFNGAMAFQPWILEGWSVSRRVCSPSMEPWPFSHGYVNVYIDVTDTKSLQWSHGLSAMDTRAAQDAAGRDCDPPSMEPWPFSHGYTSRFEVLKWYRTAPSMEPWPFSHGYVLRCCRPVFSIVTLQWSHGLSAMDTWRPCGGFRRGSSLQWSHGLSAMDTGNAERCEPHGRQPSMEPWPFSHGYR